MQILLQSLKAVCKSVGSFNNLTQVESRGK